MLDSSPTNSPCLVEPKLARVAVAIKLNSTIKFITMKAILIFCLFTTALSFPDRQARRGPSIPDLNSQDTKVVGGEDAAPNSQPHQVSFQYPSGSGFNHLCGGSILSETKIVTAAHCVEAVVGISGLRVVAGEHDLTKVGSAEQIVAVKSAVRHPSYNPNTIDWDYGVLTLATPLVYTAEVQPIRLALSNDVASGNCKTSGWGKTTPESGAANILQLITLPIVAQVDCSSIYSSIFWGITDRMVCAGGQLGRSVCNGDSGGPLVCKSSDNRDYLAGITSYTMTPCGETEYPSGWANVAAGREWILEN